jgi:hypothetical protein
MRDLNPRLSVCKTDALTSELIAPNGALGGARTHDLSLRRAALYPTELQAREVREVDWCRGGDLNSHALADTTP